MQPAFGIGPLELIILAACPLILVVIAVVAIVALSRKSNEGRSSGAGVGVAVVVVGALVMLCVCGGVMVGGLFIGRAPQMVPPVAPQAVEFPIDEPVEVINENTPDQPEPTEATPPDSGEAESAAPPPSDPPAGNDS